MCKTQSVTQSFEVDPAFFFFLMSGMWKMLTILTPKFAASRAGDMMMENNFS